jgi:hypothetical protein
MQEAVSRSANEATQSDASGSGAGNPDMAPNKVGDL